MKIDVVGIRLVKEREIDYDKSIHQPIDTVNFVLEEMQDLDREMCMTLNLDAYNGNYNLIDYECNGNASSIWIRKDLTSNEIEVCRIIDKHFDVFKNLEDRVDIDLFNIRKEEISTERNEIEEDLDEIEM